MDDNNSGSWISGIVGTGIVIAIIFWLSGSGKYEGESAQYWYESYAAENAKAVSLRSQIDEYQAALQEANDNIDEAKYYSGETYEEMEEALESLETVSEPY